ncbi:MAG: PD40 domain-containing protein [Verrucomicrobia bacterium]|nr:PD40 domain-containing protein [Verrucomicrobiota bacterium]
MFRLPLLICTLTVLVLPEALVAESTRHICFSRDGGVWIANLDGTGARKIFTGDDPAISPDGARIAYTETGKGKETIRHIAVIEVSSGKKAVFRNLPSDNAYGPLWSPDGEHLLFNIFTENRWRLGLIGVDGTGFQFIPPPPAVTQDIFSPAWATDGKGIYAQDMTNIYQIDLDGKTLAQWKISGALSNADMNSSDRIVPSDDGKTFLVDADLNEEGNIKSWEGPPPAVFLFDVSAGKGRQVSPSKVYAWDPCWLNPQEYLFTSTTDGRHFGIYKTSLSGEKPRLIINNASSVTVSAR